MPIAERTCRRCRAKRPKKELLRLIILENGVLEADSKQRWPGRGWYVCRQQGCLALFQNVKTVRKIFGQGLEIGPVLTNWITMPPAGEDYAQSKSL